MKLLASIGAAGAILALAAGPASALIPADGGYTDGLRTVYATPVTAHSGSVRERYYPCKLAGQRRLARVVVQATTDRWCRYLPTIRRDTAPTGSVTSSGGAQGSILSIPLSEWTPL